MPLPPRSWLSLLVIPLLCSSCGWQERVAVAPTPEERVLLGQLTRDPYVEVMDLDRNDLEHLVVTTRQGSTRVRYVFKPARPGDTQLLIHKLDDRARLEVSESDQLGTGPQPGRSGRYR
jgi:hypothetical protein